MLVQSLPIEQARDVALDGRRRDNRPRAPDVLAEVDPFDRRVLRAEVERAAFSVVPR